MLRNARERWRRQLFSNRVYVIIGENPLGIAMTTWGLFTGINMATGSAPSKALSALPDGLETMWGVMMVLGAVVTSFSIAFERDVTQATGLYLFACTNITYSVAIIALSGWERGGQIGAFLMIMGIICFLRGWWLKTDAAAEIRVLVRGRRKEVR